MKRTTGVSPARKKPYARPQLTRYGKFKDLVRGAGGNKNDPGGANRSRT